MYYCNSRYYNPEWGRWLNADSVVGQPGLLLSHNLFAYCANNPVNMMDPDGYFAFLIPIIVTAPEWIPAVCAGAAAISGGIAIGWGISQAKEQSRAKTQTISISKTKDEKRPTIIYRLGSGNATNLTPRLSDTNGLSYTTIKPLSGSYTETTMEGVNTTGILLAVPDPLNSTHILVTPTNITTLDDWIDSRPTALTNPHPYTSFLQSISLKVK